MVTKHSIFILCSAQAILFILFCSLTVYNTKYDLSKYPLFQDVHVMVFIGFGFLMVFLKRYGYSSLGFTFLLGSFAVQWSVLCLGFYELNDDYKIELGIESIYRADIAAATVLISVGAVLGRTSYIQLMIMTFIEIAAYSGNLYVGTKVFQAADAGGSIFVHTFGAYFGLAVSYVLNRKKEEGGEETRSPSLESSYTSDLFAMLGTLFLWLFWPSFNAIDLRGDDQHRAVLNTYLALAACCTSAFSASLIFNSDRKFDMVHIQNATLAGGVAVGASANLMLEPYGAVIIGIMAGFISVYGYSRVTPLLEKTLNIPDTCGVHNLHGMPGVLGAVVSAIMAAVASEAVYHQSLYETFPARANPTPQPTPDYHIAPGVGRSAGEQAGYQVISLLVTLAVAAVSGFITGVILKWTKTGQVPSEFHYDDSIFWMMAEHSTPIKKVSETLSQYDNPSFRIPVNDL